MASRLAPTLRKYVHCYMPKYLAAQHVRNWAAWTEWNPVDGQAYRALFQQRRTSPAEYVEFAVSLRQRRDLPQELLASLQKDLAEEILRQATTQSETLQVDTEPWPKALKDQLLEDVAEALTLLGGAEEAEDPLEIDKLKGEAHELLIELHRSELFWVRSQLLSFRAKSAALWRGDLKEAKNLGQRMTAAGVEVGTGEEDLLLRAIYSARAVHQATKAAAMCLPRYVDLCHKELAVALASDLADLGMSRWKAKDEHQAQKYMSQALSTLSDPDLVLDSFEKMIFRSTAENLLQQQTSDMACAVDAQASEGSLELAAAIDTFNSQHGTESLCA